LGEDTLAWFQAKSDEEILDALNEDYSSMFIINTQPVESFVLDAKNETLVGLQNPVMNFYYRNGFDLNMDQSELMAPDHLSIELAFMQTLIYRDEQKPQYQFLKEHLFNWVVPYMIGMKSMANTPFYRDICDFTVEFIVADYDYCSTLAENSDG
jgi:TorA maturation chaperone TorD